MSIKLVKHIYPVKNNTLKFLILYKLMKIKHQGKQIILKKFNLKKNSRKRLKRSKFEETT